MSRLKGPRLENEIEKARGECMWKKLEELIVHCKAKGSGMEFLVNFLTGEYLLERFVDDKCNSTDGLLNPQPSFRSELKSAEHALRSVIQHQEDFKAYVVLETHLLLAKLSYVCADYQAAIDSVNQSQLDREDVQFQTLRTLRLVAEAYAIKGLSMEKLPPGSVKRFGQAKPSVNDTQTQTLYCFEKATELALAYIQELEKSNNDGVGTAGTSLSVPNSAAAGTQQPAVTPVGTNITLARALSGTDKIGEFMETAIQRVPLMQLKQTQSPQHQQRTMEKGVEYYRRILTAIGDKSVAQHLHQKLSRQLAEVLLRGVPEASYSPATKSNAAAQKAQKLRFYMGTERGYYTPENRLEEMLLVLSISEALAAREAILSRADENRTLRDDSLMNVKAVQNLLTLVLASVRQYQLLAGLFEKAMKFAYDDRFLWYQFALSLMSYGKYSRASLVLKECIDEMSSNEADPVHLIFAAKMAIEHLANYDEGAKYAMQAVEACQGGWLTTRAYLMLGLSHSLKAQMGATHAIRNNLQLDAVEAFEKAAQADPKDALAQFFLSLQHAIGRDLALAREYCECSLEMNPEQAYALMLLALLLTAENNYQEAYEVVREALDEFPSHYGLLVLRLKLEIQSGRSDSALATARDLLMFWKMTDSLTVPMASQAQPGATAQPNSSIITMDERIRTSQSPPTTVAMTDNRANLVSPTTAGKVSTDSGYTLGAGNSMAGLRSASSMHLHSGHGPASMTMSTSTIDVTGPTITSSPSKSIFPSKSMNLLLPPAQLLSAARKSLTDLSLTPGTPDRESVTLTTAAMSEWGHASTVSDSVGFTSSSLTSAHNKWRRQANIWLELAELFLDAGKLVDVHKCVEEAMQLFPNSHQTMYLKGRLLLIKAADTDSSEKENVDKMLNEAKACFLGALSILPNHVSSLRQLTQVYHAEGNLKMAEKVFRDLIKIEPLDHLSWQKLGHVLSEQGRFEEATECFCTCTRLEDTAPIMPFTVIPRMLHL